MNQHRPNTLKIEMTEGCNLRCKMCGIQGIREKAGGPFSYMTLETAHVVTGLLAETTWDSKVEFAMRGEPLMNPNAAAIIQAFRTALPKSQLMLTTNGLPMLRKPGVSETCLSLFAAGLNILAIDCYKPSRKVEEEARKLLQEGFWERNGIIAKDYPSDESPYHKYSHKAKRLFLIEDFEAAAVEGEKVGTKIASNHSGAAYPPVPEPLAKRCARPFREFTVRWDGKVSLCCNDWRGVYKVGLLGKDFKSIEEAWNSPPLVSARKMLYDRDRGFAPCSACDNISYRVGLLPDPSGKQPMAKPTKADREQVKKSGSGKSMTIPILREWEVKK